MLSGQHALAYMLNHCRGNYIVFASVLNVISSTHDTPAVDHVLPCLCCAANSTNTSIELSTEIVTALQKAHEELMAATEQLKDSYLKSVYQVSAVSTAGQVLIEFFFCIVLMLDMAYLQSRWMWQAWQRE
jgi:hypothetical protein